MSIFLILSLPLNATSSALCLEKKNEESCGLCPQSEEKWWRKGAISKQTSE